MPDGFSPMLQDDSSTFRSSAMMNFVLKVLAGSQEVLAIGVCGASMLLRRSSMLRLILAKRRTLAMTVPHQFLPMKICRPGSKSMLALLR